MQIKKRKTIEVRKLRLQLANDLTIVASMPFKQNTTPSGQVNAFQIRVAQLSLHFFMKCNDRQFLMNEQQIK